jgi:hypothetical protein
MSVTTPWLCDAVFEGECDSCLKPRFLHEVMFDDATFYVCDNCVEQQENKWQ